MMKKLFLIPARGGSKGVENKNIRLLNGKPLIWYTIEAARGIADDQDIIVSTDSHEIKKTVEGFGLEVPFLRPAELATDEATTNEVIEHAISYCKSKKLQYDVVVLLQPTSPLRGAEHIKQALKEFETDHDMVVSVKLAEANPYFTLFEERVDGFIEKSKAGNFTRRQECPDVYQLNGAIYVINVHSFVQKGLHGFSKIKKYVMDKYVSIDIDDEFDFQLAEFFLKEWT